VPDHLHVGPADRRVADPPPPTCGAHDGVGDGQSEARRPTRLGGPVEPVEEPVAIGGRDPRPAVLDRQADPAAVARHHDVDGAPEAGMATGVVDQDPGQTVDPFGRSGDARRAFTLAPDDDDHGPRHRHRPEAVGARGGHRTEVDGLGPGRGGLGVEAGQEEQVLHDAAEPPTLVADPVQDLAVRLGRTRGGQGQADLGVDDAQWGAQLVGRVRRELQLPAAGELHR
jgi:hypothetical protein